MKRRVLVLITAVICLAGISRAGNSKAPKAEGSPYLFIWSGDAVHKSSDFLAVIDANPSSPSYGRIVSSVPVGVAGTMPHHTEYEFPKDDVLFANGWVAGRTFIFDLHDPLHPRMSGQFKDEAGYSFPHSFVRLPNGHLLGTFQSHGQGYAPGGGLVEVDEKGAAIRSASAVDPADSLAVEPQIDRVVSSSTPMGWPDWAKTKLPKGSWSFQKVNEQETAQVQVWRLSDLRLLSTISLADASGKHNLFPAEPRVLADGSVYVNTFSCGLYLMEGLKGDRPSAKLVHTFPGGDSMQTICSVPVVVGQYWVQTVAALPGLIALDVSNPEKPVEVSRLKLDPRFPMPHWMAADRKSDRLVITGDDKNWVLAARIDPKGKLSLDESFREPGASVPGISFNRQEWPHGRTGPAVVHGALFGPE
jgi:hypothetical protein